MSSVEKKTDKKPNPWVCYFLLLTDAEGTPVRLKSGSLRTYIGATNNLLNRLRQHNKVKKGGANITSIGIGGSSAATQNKRRKRTIDPAEDENGEIDEKTRVWRPILHISGSNIPGLTSTQALQLEHSMKPKYASSKRKRLDLTLRKRIEGAITDSASLRGIFESLNLERWTNPSCLCVDAPVTINWWLSEWKPKENLVPNHVSERILSLEEKKQMMQLGPRALPWPILPYN